MSGMIKSRPAVVRYLIRRTAMNGTMWFLTARGGWSRDSNAGQQFKTEASARNHLRRRRAEIISYVFV
jgi:hypothetical protein